MPAKPAKTASESIKHSRGRPRGSVKLIPDEKTIAQIKELSLIQCSQEQAAAVLGVHRNTFANFLCTYKKARLVWEMGRGAGDAGLLLARYKKAMAGNVPMLIWLGKIRLNQRDNLQIGGIPGAAPIGLEHSVDAGLTALLLAAKLENKKGSEEK